jgi:hypothetical protein
MKREFSEKIAGVETRARTPRRLAIARVCYVLFAAGPVSFSLACIAFPIRDRWPPGELERAHRVDVIYSDWHSRIVETEIEEGAETETGGAVGETYLVWDFAEKAWYLDEEQGTTGIFRALCWPTASCVGAEEDDEAPWEDENPPEPIEGHWTFYLSSRGYDEMKRYMESMKGEAIEGWPRWFWGKRDYQVFYNCNQFTATALRRAGLPIRPWCAIAGPMIRKQLDRADAMETRLTGEAQSR